VGPKYGPFKARDFLTVVNYNKYDNGTYIILNRPAYVNNFKTNKKYVRATVLLAGNIIKPISDKKTHLTLIAHINPGGGADTRAAAWLINKLCAFGPPTFMKKLEAAANKKHVLVEINNNNNNGLNNDYNSNNGNKVSGDNEFNKIMKTIRNEQRNYFASLKLNSILHLK
jgi:hypothetical protein